jgi:ABC-type antimicrobial peptide transport system permease subunit
MPGVVSASPTNVSPLSGDFSFGGLGVPGQRPSERTSASINWVGPDFFKTLGTPLLAGRMFTERDGRVNKVAIVNERTASHFWPHESPIGKHVSVSRDDCEIVGVVKDVKSESLREGALAAVYLPFRQYPRSSATLHVRVAGSAAPVIAALRREIQKLDPNLPVLNVTTMAEQLNRTIALDRLMATLTALFGLLAVALATVGLYGVMAFTVAARTREIGIRMALGASHARVLYGLSATDPWTYALLSALLAGIALSAAWIPARRAARVDPMVALRYE